MQLFPGPDEVASDPDLWDPQSSPVPSEEDEDDRECLGTSSEAQNTALEDTFDINYQDMPLGLDLDDFFPEQGNPEINSENEPNTPAALSPFLELDGKKYLKSSIVATLSNNRSKKATMRTLRVQGVAVEDLRGRRSRDYDPTDLDSDEYLKAGDLAATLLRAGDHISLGILLVKGFRVKKDRSIRTSMTTDELEDRTNKAKVLCQIMEMRNPYDVAQHNPADFWEWTGKYLHLDVDSREEKVTQRLFVSEVPGHLVHPLAPSVSKQSEPDPSSMSVDLPTWSTATKQLNEMLDFAWSELDPKGPGIAGNIAELCEVTNPGLPYKNAHSQYFISCS